MDKTGQKRMEGALPDPEKIIRSAIDGLGSHVCVLDGQGRIVLTNQSWKKFAAENGSELKASCEGANYLEVCDRVISENGEAGIQEVAAAIRAVIAGSIPEFVSEYPCHSPELERWIILRATPSVCQGRNMR